MRQDQKWCAGLVFPDYLQALAAGFACPDLAADVLAKLLYEELQEHEAVLRGVWETTTVAMLVAMCSRHRGALFRHWAPVASAFAVVLLVSVKVLGSPGDAAAAKSPQLNGQEHEGGAQELVDEEAKMVDDDEARRIGLVQRLTGGMQAFLVPPADPATKSEEGLPDEEQQVARVEAQVVLALVRHVIPCARGAQVRLLSPACRTRGLRHVRVHTSCDLHMHAIALSLAHTQYCNADHVHTHTHTHTHTHKQADPGGSHVHARQFSRCSLLARSAGTQKQPGLQLPRRTSLSRRRPWHAATATNAGPGVRALLSCRTRREFGYWSTQHGFGCAVNVHVELFYPALLCLSVGWYMHVYVYVYYMYMYVYIYVYVCMCICIYVYSICMYVYVYMYICIYVYVYMYMYICICI